MFRDSRSAGRRVAGVGVGRWSRGGRSPRGPGGGSRVDVSLLGFLAWIRLFTGFHFVSAACDISKMTLLGGSRAKMHRNCYRGGCNESF